MAKHVDLRRLSKLGTLRQIEIFLKVAELGSIARASEELCLAQPSVSIQVKKLSDAIGLPLYEVIGKSLKLTTAGRHVEAAGKEIFQTIDGLDTTINDLKGLKSGTLSISVVSTAKYFLPYILAPFCELHPGVEVKLHIGNRDVIVDRLKDNVDDLYFFSELPHGMEVTSYPFLPNPIVVIASKQHPLSKRKKLRWQDIENERFIMRETGADSMIRVQDYLTKNGLRMHDVMTIQSNEAIKHAVMADMGISILSAYILSNADTDGLTQLNVEGFPIMSQWELAHLKNKQLSPVAQRLLEFILEHGRKVLPMKKIEENVQSAIHGNWGS